MVMLQHRVLLLVLAYLISLAMLVLLQAAPLEEWVLPKQQQLLQSFPATQQQRENAMLQPRPLLVTPARLLILLCLPHMKQHMLILPKSISTGPSK